MSDVVVKEGSASTTIGIATAVAIIAGGSSFGAGYFEGLKTGEAEAIEAAAEAAKANEEPDQYITMYAKNPLGGDDVIVTAKGKDSVATAAVDLGLVAKNCGSTPEAPTNCPELPASKICALCPPEWHNTPLPERDPAIDECPKSWKILDSGHCQQPTCNPGDYPGAKGGCEHLAGTPCNNGIWPDGGACDPRKPPCEPWPCSMQYGDNPERQILIERDRAKMDRPDWAAERFDAGPK